MWKKKESESQPPSTVGAPPVQRPAPPRPRPDRAVIGPTLRIQGEISGQEDLLVQGRIDGRIVVEGKTVTIGKSGKVRADIHASSIRVEGRVRGDLIGVQEGVIEASGDVEGNLKAPSVRLENGSRFKGSIDMESTRSAAPARPMVPPGETAGEAKGRQAQPAPSAPGQPTRST